jgi:hypothetical protein
MNRRQFVSTVGAATVGASILGCSPQGEVNPSVARAVPLPSPLPSPLSGPAVKAGSKTLMVFMLAISQRTADGGNLIDIFFPSDGTPPSAAVLQNNHLKELGVGDEEIKAFVTNLRAAWPNDVIRARFALVHDMFETVFFYNKPDCPSTVALQNIIAKAAEQGS